MEIYKFKAIGRIEGNVRLLECQAVGTEHRIGWNQGLKLRFGCNENSKFNILFYGHKSILKNIHFNFNTYMSLIHRFGTQNDEYKPLNR